MTGLPARRVELVAPSKPDADWTARLALGGAAAFVLLLAAFGLILLKSWPQMSGADRTVLALSDKTDRVADGQESLSRDIASLRTDLRQDRSDRTDSSREVAVLRARVGELSTTVNALRAQADKLEAEGASRPAPTAAPAAAPAQPDPAVIELRERLDAIQRKLGALAAAPAPAPANPTPSAPPAPLADYAAVKPAPSSAPTPRSPAYPVDEIEREVRDMQSVINQQQQARSAASQSAPPLAPAPAAKPARSGIADPLAPMTSRTPPRIAPTNKRSASSVGPVGSSSVSRVPSAPVAQQTAARPGFEPRVTSVGANSAMKALGPIGLPFDAIGNLFAAIGEGLDTLFTGQEYLPRPNPADEPATARAAR